MADYWCCKADFGKHEPECPNACPDCLGSGGEWIDRKDPRNSTYCMDNDEDEFVPCSRCHGTGSSAKFDIDSDTACLIKFQKLANEWRQQRGAMSSITEMSMLPAYQAILGMGPSAIKPIIAQLKSEGDEPDQWFWALRSITEANPVKADEQGDFIKMAQAWIRWAENEGYAG